MTTQESRRKLAAILSADVKGYSRLMSQDEEATVKTAGSGNSRFQDFRKSRHRMDSFLPGF